MFNNSAVPPAIFTEYDFLLILQFTNKTDMKKEIHYVSADEAVKVIKSGDHVHLSSVASAPQILINAMCRRGEAGEIKNVKVHHLHTEGPAPYSDPKFEGIFFHQGFFIGANVRRSACSYRMPSKNRSSAR